VISSVLRFCFATCCVGWILLTRPALADDKPAPSTRITIFLSSADDIIADAEHLVVDLAGEQQQWENNVFPNIDIFLIGVDTSRPIFFDQLMDAEFAQRAQLSVPVSDLNEFIQDNLDPLGIIVTPVRRKKDYYQLEDVYEGWMRIVDNYAAFGEHEGDVPERMLSPQEANAELLSRGNDAGVQLNNALTTLEQRTASFATFRENTMAAVKKRPRETNEEFALRQKGAEQQLELVERLFVQSAEITVGLVIDAKKNEARGDLLLTAVPDSELQAMLKLQAEKHSYFASLESARDATLSGRVSFALDELLQRHASETYPLTRPVVMEKIDADETHTSEQKEARKEIAGIVLDMFEAGSELGVIDAAVEVNPAAEGGTQIGVLGVRVTDGTSAEKIVELLPQASPNIKTELNVDEAGDVKIHRLTVTENYPAPLAEFFGKSGEFFIGTGPDAVWIAGGSGGLNVLKEAIAAVAGAPEGDVDPAIARLDMHLLPVLKLLKGLRDEGTLNLMQLVPQPDEEPAESKEEDEENPASMLKDFHWGAAAIEALSGEDDLLHFEVKRVDDHLEGDGSMHEGILKAIGELIAKFARENLG
jgi:hypothetical protein